jgi:cephalosporin hydroxylase
MLMVSTVCRFKPSMIFEWGTHIGKSARIFYETTEAFGIMSAIHSIDLPDHVSHNEHPHERRGILVRNISAVTLHQADGLDRSFELLSKMRPQNGRVLFFVGGDHDYDSVKKELQTILSGAPNAVVLLHDTFFQSKESGYNVGPHEAITEVLSVKGGYRTVATNTGLPGMSLVCKP